MLAPATPFVITSKCHDSTFRAVRSDLCTRSRLGRLFAVLQRWPRRRLPCVRRRAATPGQRRAAGASTSDSAAATPVIAAMFDGMGKDATVAVKVVASGDDDNPTAKLDYTWTFGPGRTFGYEADATAAKAGDDWHVQWSPTVLHPKLRAGMTFQFSDDKNFLTPVVDRDGQPLLSWQTIGVVDADARSPRLRRPVGRGRTAIRRHHDRGFDQRPVQGHAGRHRHRDQAPRTGSGAGGRPTGGDSRRRGEQAGCAADGEPATCPRPPSTAFRRCGRRRSTRPRVGR